MSKPENLDDFEKDFTVRERYERGEWVGADEWFAEYADMDANMTPHRWELKGLMEENPDTSHRRTDDE